MCRNLRFRMCQKTSFFECIAFGDYSNDGRNARTHGGRWCLFIHTLCVRACAVWRQGRRTLALPAALRPSLLSLRPQTACLFTIRPKVDFLLICDR